MKTLIKTLVVITIVALNNFCSPPETKTIANGQQPQLSIDNSGTIRMVYGNEGKIYCATSNDNGLSFPDIQLVGEVEEMHLGMTRGPQLATSKNYSLVSAMDKKGNIHSFKLTHASGEWVKTNLINDVSRSAPEGLMDIAADQADNFYAVWLDIRNEKKNNICFASTSNQGKVWSKNSIIYTSPDQNVCECCKPSIEANKNEVSIMFRNWINGSRDLYLIQSDNKGTQFADAVKLGNGTWKLDGCPMDGGGLVVGDNLEATTVWQRKGEIYFSKPNEAEALIGKGRSCSIADANNPIAAWQDGKMLVVEELEKGKKIEVGEGSFIKVIRTKDGQIFSAWEQEKNILYKRI